jgi:hypothetical protein
VPSKSRLNSARERKVIGTAGGGQPGPNVKELTDGRLFGQVADHVAQGQAVSPGDHRDRWQGLAGLPGGFPVSREMVLPAQPVVPYPAG